MAKRTRKAGVKIEGVNRLFQGDRIVFINEVCVDETFVSSLENEEGVGSDRIIADGVTAINVDTFQPINIPRNTLWGIACTTIDVDGVTTRTPQALHDAGRFIYLGGTDAIENGRVYSVGDVYFCELYSKKRDTTYPWDIVGLDFTDEHVKIDKTKISFNEKSINISDLKKLVADLDARQSEKAKDYIIK